MPDMPIEPFSAVGAVRFGSKASEVHGLLGPPYKSFRTPLHGTLTDAYLLPRTLRIDYDVEERVKDVLAVEGTGVRLGDLRFFEYAGSGLAKELRLRGYTVDPDLVGFYVGDLGIAVSVLPQDKLEAVTVFSRAEFQKFVEFVKRSMAKHLEREKRRKEGLGPKNPFGQANPSREGK